MSVEYYAKLERGSLAGVSAGVLDSLAHALRLDDAERAHLLRLAHEADGSSAILWPRRRPKQWTTRPGLQWALDAITAPAIVGNDRHRPGGAGHELASRYLTAEVDRKHSILSITSAVLLAAGTGLLVPAAVVASAYVLFGDERGHPLVDVTHTSHRQAPVDPNEAARAAGSWG
jgi:hypothetical protein